jgi:hypothetical protein
MDLLDYTDCKLYFEEPLPSEAEALIAQASQEYGEPAAEAALLKAQGLAPENLSVLVGLYRYYFYQHRLEDALLVAERALQISGGHLGLPSDWRSLDESQLSTATVNSFGMLRFHLIALKAASIVMLRLGQISGSRDRLHKIAALDSRDQLGAAKLLEVVDAFQQEESQAPRLRVVH